jgi:hypothetical protein
MAVYRIAGALTGACRKAPHTEHFSSRTIGALVGLEDVLVSADAHMAHWRLVGCQVCCMPLTQRYIIPLTFA